MEQPLESVRRRHREKLIFLMVAGAIGIALMVVAIYQTIEFSDSVGFCGLLCHEVMYPEYTAYQASPHSRVTCAQCHVGSGADYLVRSKLTGIPLIFATIFGTYERPIPTPVANLRPARDTCEQCHRPQLFTGDLVRARTTFLTDEVNTKAVDNRVLRIGGGQARVARGIHWHIAARVWYVPLDRDRQEIAWVGTEGANGYADQFVDPGRPEIAPGRIEQEKRLMDCIDCHNRATHIFRSPAELADQALVEGTLDSSLPFIKKLITDVLYPANPSLERAESRLDGIREFYRASYPQVYSQKRDAIESAITEAKNIARLTTFPDMNVTWNTYVDQAGHQDSPGCFRCHGRLVPAGASGAGQALNARCDLCHYSLAPGAVIAR